MLCMYVYLHFLKLATEGFLLYLLGILRLTGLGRQGVPSFCVFYR